MVRKAFVVVAKKVKLRDTPGISNLTEMIYESTKNGAGTHAWVHTLGEPRSTHIDTLINRQHKSHKLVFTYMQPYSRDWRTRKASVNTISPVISPFFFFVHIGTLF